MIRDLAWIDIYFLLFAARWTIGLTVIAMIGGGLIGLLIAACGAIASPGLRFLRWFAHGYTAVVQGIPLLAWLFIFYFGPPLFFRMETPPLLAVGIGFSVYAGAFLGEIWRGSIASIPKTQWEAGKSIGLTYIEQLRYIIIPQAIKVATPPTVGFIVQLIKNTSLASTVGFVELTREGQMTTSATFKPLEIYSIVALIYFLICYPLTQYSRFLEGKLRVIH